jgi:hypothetical protein
VARALKWFIFRQHSAEQHEKEEELNAQLRELQSQQDHTPKAASSSAAGDEVSGSDGDDSERAAAAAATSDKLLACEQELVRCKEELATAEVSAAHAASQVGEQLATRDVALAAAESELASHVAAAAAAQERAVELASGWKNFCPSCIQCCSPYFHRAPCPSCFAACFPRKLRRRTRRL